MRFPVSELKMKIAGFNSPKSQRLQYKIGFLPTLSGKNIARAVFLLTENKVKYKYPISIFGECVPVGIGRGVRQVRRLLRLLYRSRHFFFIHVDETSHWMYSQLVSLNRLPNIRSVKVGSWSFYAIEQISVMLSSFFLSFGFKFLKHEEQNITTVFSLPLKELSWVTKFCGP